MNDFYQSFAPDQMYTDEYVKHLREKDLVIYCYGVHAVRIIPRKGMNPLFEILGEDDGQLFSYRHPITFDLSWTEDLKCVLDNAIAYWETIKEKYQ